jgi:Xaa-Pro aminopeptidase
VKLTTDVNASLAHLAGTNSTSTVYAITGQVSDHVTFIGFENKDFELLKPAIETSRVVKDEFEVAMIRKANAVSSAAHKAVVERAKKASNERELEAVFLERCVANGAKEMAYHPIVASGTAAATLHYVPNDAPLGGKQLLLIDAGAEWDNYAADIVSTCSFATASIESLLTVYTATDQNLSPQRQVHQGGPRNLRHRLQDAARVHRRHQGRHALGRRPRAGPQDCH